MIYYSLSCWVRIFQCLIFVELVWASGGKLLWPSGHTLITAFRPIFSANVVGMEDQRFLTENLAIKTRRLYMQSQRGCPTKLTGQNQKFRLCKCCPWGQQTSFLTMNQLSGGQKTVVAGHPRDICESQLVTWCSVSRKGTTFEMGYSTWTSPFYVPCFGGYTGHLMHFQVVLFAFLQLPFLWKKTWPYRPPKYTEDIARKKRIPWLKSNSLGFPWHPRPFPWFLPSSVLSR